MFSSIACRTVRSVIGGGLRPCKVQRPMRTFADKTGEKLAAMQTGSSKGTLLDTPVSNHGARVRFIIYKKGIESEIEIASPATCGGLRSPEYLALNPQGKMPTLKLPDGTAIPESEVIALYLLDCYKSHPPAFEAATPELRARAALITRYMDMYVHPIQGCMYRRMDSAEARARDIRELRKQLDILESLVAEGGPYLVGQQVTGADAAVLPTLVFMDRMLPSHFGWKDGIFTGRPRLEAWWKYMSTQDAAAQKVISEVRGALQEWEHKRRWQELGIDQQVAEHPELQWA